MRCSTLEREEREIPTVQQEILLEVRKNYTKDRILFVKRKLVELLRRLFAKGVG